jgi:hypothetical protein
VTGPEHLTGPQHSERAEELIAQAHEAGGADRYSQMIAEAQVHATLALAAGHDDQPRAGWYPWLVLLVAGCFAGLAIFAYNGLSHWYRPVTVNASTNNLGALTNVIMSGPKGSPAEWMIQQGYVGRLTVTGPGPGTADVILPVPASNCAALAKDLGTTCLPGNQLQIGNPVTFSWSKPDLVSSNWQPVPVGLNIASSLARPANLGVTIAPLASSSTGATPSVCFENPRSTTAMLTIKGGPVPFNYSGPWLTVCAAGESGVGISVGVHLPEFDFGGISNFALCASAPEATLQGFTGQVNLMPGPATVMNSPTTISMQSRQAAPLVVSLGLDTNGQLSCTPGQAAPACTTPVASGSLAVCGQAATGVLTDSGQLVPSEWNRDSPFIVPLFGGVVAALVLAPLGVSVQAFMDALKRLRFTAFTDAVKRRRGRFRRRRTAAQDSVRKQGGAHGS